MKLTEWMDKSLPAVVERLTRSAGSDAMASEAKQLCLASQKAVHAVVNEFAAILFPGCHSNEPVAQNRLEVFYDVRLRSAAALLAEQVENAFHYEHNVEKRKACADCRNKADDAVIYLVESLPAIRMILQRDIQAIYDGDPAAKSLMEIVMSYPGLEAVAVYRLAHLLYEKNVPLIPRIMTELAHSRTGIDIHPGAKIGGGFCIDHGTGVVIGETCVIGENVKLYQGVTLGALSFPKDEHGNPIKGIKRHPEVRDNVTIYSGATILGGDTVVGEGAEIGGNVWLTHSVPAGSKVYNQQPQPRVQISRNE